jgi:DNA modification methylase
MSGDLTILQGDVLAMLKTLPDESVQCVVTSPPYWGLRDYGVAGQIGREESFAGYLASLVAIFAEVRRVLLNDGTLWLNMGDCYASAWPCPRRSIMGAESLTDGRRAARPSRLPAGTKEKDLVGQPWRLAFALQNAGAADTLALRKLDALSARIIDSYEGGEIPPKVIKILDEMAREYSEAKGSSWYLRQDIIWQKPNPMPESVHDRCTRAHEYIFLLTKSPRYYYDADAIRNPPSEALLQQVNEGYNGTATKDFTAAGVQDASAVKSRIIEGMRKRVAKKRGAERQHQGFADKWDGMTRAEQMACGSNARSVWTINTRGYKGAHFATFPEELPRRCILAGTRPGDVVLDPFGGSGTTAAVALGLGRRAVTIELNPEYVQLIRERCGLFALPAQEAKAV